jgi:hypothetical protein
MKRINRYQKTVAAFLFWIMLAELLLPLKAVALTSGPAQPEMKGFEPVSGSDMVDLFTGDFSYNIPLLDVGGYPVNLSYHSGSGMDDEASWVGSGWSLSPGTLNRQMRGLPDDFNGQDVVTKQKSMRTHITKGLNLNLSIDLFAIPGKKGRKKSGKKKSKGKAIKFKPSLGIGVKHDNYRGIGTEISANVGITLGKVTSGEKTADIDQLNSKKLGKGDSSSFAGKGLSFNFGLNSSSMDGAGFNPSVNFSVLNKQTDKRETNLSYNIGFPVNSREGLKGMTLSSSFSTTLRPGQSDNESNGKEKRKNISIGTSGNGDISFVGNTYMPSSDFPKQDLAFSGSIDAGFLLFGFYAGLGITGYYSEQKLAQTTITNPAYGFLYNEKAVQNTSDNSMMDFNREKDIPYSPKVNNLPIPVPTNDFFTASSQEGSGQYRVYRGSHGVFADPGTISGSTDLSFGLELGFVNVFQIGGNFHYQSTKTTDNKWTNGNQFLDRGDFQGQQGDGTYAYEPAYFKRVGEPIITDPGYYEKIKNKDAFAVKLARRGDKKGAGLSTDGKLSSNRGFTFDPSLRKTTRDKRNNSFSYLNGIEATLHGYESKLYSYQENTLAIKNCVNQGAITPISRLGGAFASRRAAKPHHISEVTITAESGQRMIYGTPVYNNYQEDVTFNIAPPASADARRTGIATYNHNENSGDNSPENRNGRDWYYSRDMMPGYATSYLLNAILSPDYVDITGNGVTDDDQGTAVRFNYTKLSQPYKWRTPYTQANYSEGFLSDNNDDKANYSYGEKETWYMHSIESKTMIAQFIVENRDDALGVAGKQGGINSATRLKLLKEIRLYSKSDIVANAGNLNNAVPIKVVHFEYDYSLYKNLPNNVNTGVDNSKSGKLTLKKVWFTFGNSQKGQLNPYKFSYDTTSYSKNFYDQRQYDRWGNYKDADANPYGLNNSEYPYTLQDKVLSDKFASMWQMNKIELPSGGVINVTYESDDYAYVQNKRASQMCTVSGIGAVNDSSGLIRSEYVHIRLPEPLQSSGLSNQKKELKFKYFGDMEYLYFKFFIDVDGRGHKEFVPGYAKILDYTPVGATDVRIKLDRLKDDRKRSINPIAYTSWSFLRQSLPKYAYPGYDNLDEPGSDFVKAIKSLGQALSNIKELIEGFGKTAIRRNYSNNVDISKSWVRLNCPSFKRMGGGSRVKKVEINDNWDAMSGTPGAKAAAYTQLYDYTTTIKGYDGNDMTISSGVASYEPLLGGDENPWKQPVFISNKKILTLNEHNYIERPFGESFFPGPGIGYSKVTVTNVGTGTTENKTGKTVSEFYTAKEFPTVVEELPLQKKLPRWRNILKILKVDIKTFVGLSQGYAVRNNDMHGKQKVTTTYNKGGGEISKAEFFYKTSNALAENQQLNNQVKVVTRNGTVKDAVLGEEIEAYSDQREQIHKNKGLRIQVSGGTSIMIIIPLPFAFPGLGGNNEQRCYRASSTIKLVHSFAVLDKVRKTENGSSITTENMLWDEETGDILLTKTQNEYDDPVFNFTYPAHWAYSGMGQAYQNIGAYIDGLTTNASGVISNSSLTSGPSPALFPGDELIEVFGPNKYWVVNTLGQYRLIDQAGNLKQVNGINVKVLRSGKRNMADVAIASLASLNNPIVNGQLNVSNLTKILDAKATLFSEEWNMPHYCLSCPDGFEYSPENNYCFRDTIPIVNNNLECARICVGDVLTGTYSVLGSRIYAPGYDINGDGTVLTTLQTSGIWRNDGCNPGSKAQNIKPLTKEDSAIGQIGKGEKGSPALTDDHHNCALNDTVRTNFCGPLHRAGIWSCEGRLNGNRLPTQTWLGFSRCITVDSTKTYYLGIASDNRFRIRLDGVTIVQKLNDVLPNFQFWHIYPVTLTAGRHIVEMEAYNQSSFGAFGAEIYDNTYNELVAATNASQLNTTILSTANMMNQEFDLGVRSCPDGYALDLCSNEIPVCRRIVAPVNTFNPYFAGVLGNWRAKQSFAYHIDRENIAGNPAQNGSTNIRKSGAYSSFTPFWVNGGGSFIPNYSGDANWVWANTVNYFNTKGAELQNQDALNRYSGALFGYLESVPVAIASNAQYREIAYEGFEDFNYDLQCNTPPGCGSARRHLDFKALINGTTVTLNNAEAHSGRSSLKLSSGSITLTKDTSSNSTVPVPYTFDGSGRYQRVGNIISKGFAPQPGKPYVLSFWVKDSKKASSTNLQVSVGSTQLITSTSQWPVVEGWKRVEVKFTMPALSPSFQLSFNAAAAGVVYLDDIRLHPFDAQMKTFAYDASSMRPWAEMDENNFATFYEYDDEGILIRVKKETERGIMTIRETRSAYKKN